MAGPSGNTAAVFAYAVAALGPASQVDGWRMESVAALAIAALLAVIAPVPCMARAMPSTTA